MLRAFSLLPYIVQEVENLSVACFGIVSLNTNLSDSWYGGGYFGNVLKDRQVRVATELVLGQMTALKQL